MKYRSNSMLALIPQSNEGEIFLQQLQFFQQSLKMRVFLLNISKPISSFTRNFRTKKAVAIKIEAKENFKQFIEKKFPAGIPEEYILRVHSGKNVPLLINESQKGGYEFICIEKSGENYPGALTKTEIDRFISQSFCPVLTINKNYPVHEIKKIVIPIDIAQSTKKRLYWATHFAKKYHAKIQIVSALNIDMDETKSLAFKNAEKIKTMLTSRGVVCDVEILKVHKQESQKAVLNYIAESRPDMVIIRTHQESIFTEKRIGRFVSEIVHGCTMPVFTVGQSTEMLATEIG